MIDKIDSRSLGTKKIKCGTTAVAGNKRHLIKDTKQKAKISSNSLDWLDNLSPAFSSFVRKRGGGKRKEKGV